MHHYVLDPRRGRGMLLALAAEPAAAAGAGPGSSPSGPTSSWAARVVLAGMMRHFGFDSCLASEADILDGLVATLLGG